MNTSPSCYVPYSYVKQRFLYQCNAFNEFCDRFYKEAVRQPLFIYGIYKFKYHTVKCIPHCPFVLPCIVNSFNKIISGSVTKTCDFLICMSLKSIFTLISGFLKSYSVGFQYQFLDFSTATKMHKFFSYVFVY